ncbi:MAG: NAD(P)/FAD-dependent oxidoreductase [Nitrososphaerota archaeon]
MSGIAIVGGGVAGLSCAIFAANKNVPVTVYERKRRIGFPVRSTGGIAAHYLESSGLGFKSDWTYPLTKAIVVSPSGYRYEFEAGGKVIGYVLDHGEFERYLAEKAMDLGVKFVMPIQVKPGTIGQLLNAYDYVVGADGPYSAVRRFIGIPDEDQLNMHKGYEYWVDGSSDPVFDLPQNSILIYFNNNIAPKGYVWFFRYKDIIKFGLGVPIAVPADPKKILDSVARKLMPTLFKSRILGKTGGVIPTPPPLESVVKDRIALVGDAGNLINSATGGGIHMALFSGRQCGLSLAEGSLRSYVRWYERSAKPVLKRWYTVKNILYSLDNNGFDRLVRAMQGYELRSLSPVNEIFRLLVHVMSRNPSLLVQFIAKFYLAYKIMRRGSS